MMRGSYFRRPILRFRDGTALTPYQGFKNEFKPYKQIDHLKVGVIVPTKQRGFFQSLWNSLIHGVKGFGGLKKWFDLSDVQISEQVETPNYNYEKAVESMDYKNVDVVIIVVPDKLIVPYDKDPYLPFKQKLSRNGAPSQMIAESTLTYGNANPYLLFNLALSLFSKAGGIPWTLDEPLNGDVFIGIDSSRPIDKKHFAINLIYNIKGDISLRWDLYTVESPSEKLSEETINKIIFNNVAYVISEKNLEVENIIIHRDGLPFDEEISGAKKAISQLVKESLVKENVGFSFVCVKKIGTPKVFKSISRRYGNPEKGFYVTINYDEGLVLTTGYPEFPPYSPTGRVNPLEVQVAYSNREINIRERMKEVYYLSELHWASGLRSAKLPITILYADRIAKFAYLGVIPHKSLTETLWFL